MLAFSQQHSYVFISPTVCRL